MNCGRWTGRALACALAAAALAAGAAARAAEADPRDAALREEALAALKRGVTFFRTQVAVQGTYLWQYSEDLAKREGEGKAAATQGWIQPPGTPSVGMALLDAHDATGDAFYLDAARETAHGLARGQLKSGGWTYLVDFDPAGARPLAYRRMEARGKRPRNVTTFDDDTTQAAVRFLLRADAALKFADPLVHDAARTGLESTLLAQYPNGAWPQGYEEFPDAAKFPVRKASYPDDWPREHPGAAYWHFYTLNDNVLATMVATLLDAERVCRAAPADAGLRDLADRCRAAVAKAGDFILLAQMPDPQPGWAQQYDFDMHPVWARKFEPPAVTGGESHGALRTLLTVFRNTGDRKYLEPVPRALEYYRASRRPDGRLARFYELRTNRPLYFTKDYRLTYDDADVPTHYSFIQGDWTGEAAREFDAVRNLSDAALARLREKDAARASGQPGTAAGRAVRVDDRLRNAAKSAIAAQDDRGRWVEDGRLRYHGGDDPTTRVIRCETFIRHVQTLSRYVGGRGE
jgi:PelA/Pel-15E family pectate lyase